ncbi:MAG: mycofactocin biosynthesis glycosyltransferase MftF [Mycobacteriaceae bacterium]
MESGFSRDAAVSDRTRLPDGFAIQLDSTVQVFQGGALLLGGSPTRLIRLGTAAQNLFIDGRLEVQNALTAALARRLLDATVAHPRPTVGPSIDQLSVVIPVRDNLVGLLRLLEHLHGMPVVVVDDGSQVPLDESKLKSVLVPGSTLILLRHEQSLGPAAARNSGLLLVKTEYVAFLDSDVVPERGWTDLMLGHFLDPQVALVAPRIVSLDTCVSAISRYEAARSSLDLGRREAPIIAGGPVSYVPSAAIIVRVRALSATADRHSAFDERMQVGEDVDLCWRLQKSGWSLRYEPVAKVAHEHRSTFRKWLLRKVFYGTSAAPLSIKHPGSVAPLVLSRWALATGLSVSLGTRVGYWAACISIGIQVYLIQKKLKNLPNSMGISVKLVSRNCGSMAAQLAAGLCRHYWPITILAILFSGRFRKLTLYVALIDGVVDWFNHVVSEKDPTKNLDIISYLLLKRADDFAYGFGLWQGVIRRRNVMALFPKIVG